MLQQLLAEFPTKVIRENILENRDLRTPIRENRCESRLNRIVAQFVWTRAAVRKMSPESGQRFLTKMDNRSHEPGLAAGRAARFSIDGI